MKLFTRYSLVNLAANLLIFVVASIAFYFSLRFVLVNQIDEDLKIEEAEIMAHVQNQHRLPQTFSGGEQIISFTPSSQKAVRYFSTVVLMDTDDNKEEDFRRLTFYIVAAGHAYRAEVSKSLEGTNSLLYSILTISIITILVILSVSALLNRYLLKRLWKPFYASLAAIKNFRISRGEALSLPTTNTDEFQFMNQTMEQLTQTSRHEYLSLKTFSENASHETQTPIAIVRSKLDLLLQEEALSESGNKALQAAFGALERLSRLNKSLLLMAKIENNQFAEIETINLSQQLTEKLEDFSELWHAGHITVATSIQTATVTMNKELSDVLLNNLLSNATLHNKPYGNIEVQLTSNELLVKNTGAVAPLDETRLFQRFYKTSTSGINNGLGLSIMKQISEASGFHFLYEYEKELHHFRVVFSAAID